jgi:hypothetical protein
MSKLTGDQNEINRAVNLVGRIYANRVRRCVDAQLTQLAKSGVAGGIQMEPPTADDVNAVMAALRDAEDRGIHKALGPIVSHCDRHKEGSQGSKIAHAILEDVRALKSSDFALAK